MHLVDGTRININEGPPRKKLCPMRPCPSMCGTRLIRGLYHTPLASIGGVAGAESHIKALTLHPKAHMQPLPPVIAGLISGDDLVVPRGYGFKHFGPVHGGMKQSPEVRLKFNGTLDTSRGQVDAAEAALSGLQDPCQRGGVLVLPCGFGKTTVALYIASLMGGRCLVLVHKTDLMTQWVDRISQFLPGARVGVIQGPNVDSGPDHDVVVGMLQSVHAHDYGAAIEGFELLIVDEAHHVAAQTFLDAVSKVGAYAVLGLTATPDRPDGLGELLYTAVGPLVHRVERTPLQDGRLKMIHLPCDSGLSEHVMRDGKVNLSRLITDLAKDKERTHALSNAVLELLHEDRFIIVLADRVHLLVNLLALLVASKHPLVTAPNGARIVTGRTRQKDRPEALRARIILSTFALAAEGLDVPRLDTLVLATPKGDIRQALGRILRIHRDKCTPTVVDCYEAVNSGVLHGLRQKRARVHAKHGFV